MSETENKWEAAMRLLARFVLDDDRERARCGMNGITLFHVEEARALLASVKVGGGDPHPLATENARLRSALDDMVSVFTDRGEERHPDEETALAEARALLAGKPVGDALDKRIAELEEILVAIIAVDKTRYDHHEPRPDGVKPRDGVGGGSCWLTPKELAMDALRAEIPPAPAPQPDAVKVLREACKSGKHAIESLEAIMLGEHGSDWADHFHKDYEVCEAAKDGIDAALAATEGVCK